MSVFCFLHVPASLAFMESSVLLFCLLCSCGVLINKKCGEFVVTLCFASAFDNKLRTPPFFWRNEFGSDIIDLAHHQTWIWLPDLTAWMVQKSWQEHEMEQLVRRERSWGIVETPGLVLVLAREEARVPFSVVACIGIGLNWIKYRCLLLIYLNIYLQLEYWQQVNFLMQVRVYVISCFKFSIL